MSMRNPAKQHAPAAEIIGLVEQRVSR